MSITFKFIVNSPNVIEITFQDSLLCVFRTKFFGGSLGAKIHALWGNVGKTERFPFIVFVLSSQCQGCLAANSLIEVDN